MPNIIIMILSLTGRILLGLLALVFLLLLLVLFFPVTYRLRGEHSGAKLTVSARADWLFGVFRVRYAYPEPGSVTVKLLWKKLHDTSAVSGKDSGQEKKDSQEQKADGGGRTDAESGNGGSAEATGTETSTTDGAEAPGVETDNSKAEAAGTETGDSGNEVHDTDDEGADTPADGFLGKISKIKYTILKIYGKIKDIWGHWSYYAGVLREDNTVVLWKHVRQRLGKVLWAIRPRRINGSLVFGTGAPDTTGYLFGVYGMLSPLLHYSLCVTPDFTQQILEGNIDISGRITLWTLTWNGLKLLLDKKLRLFIKKMKAGRREAESKA